MESHPHKLISRSISIATKTSRRGSFRKLGASLSDDLAELKELGALPVLIKELFSFITWLLTAYRVIEKKEGYGQCLQDSSCNLYVCTANM